MKSAGSNWNPLELHCNMSALAFMCDMESPRTWNFIVNSCMCVAPAHVKDNLGGLMSEGTHDKIVLALISLLKLHYCGPSMCEGKMTGR